MLKKDEKDIVESGVEQTVASKEKTDLQNIRDEINFIMKDAAKEINAHKFTSAGDAMEFLEKIKGFVKSTKKRLNDKSSDGYVIINF